MALITIAVRPDTTVRMHDLESREGRGAGITVDGASIHLMGSVGVPTSDADIITTGLILVTAVMELVEAARGRMRAAAGLPALPDALEAATMADALAGWTPGELQEAFGS